MNSENILQPKEIIYSRRRTISLIMNSNGELIVRAPINCPLSKISKFINEKSNWIIKKKTYFLEHNIYNPLKFIDNEYLYLLGKKYEIKLTESARIKVNDSTIELPKLDSKNKLIKFLSKTAKKYITKRAEYIASIFDFKYTSISITSAHTRWGSCSYKNKLNFTYKLIMCPAGVIDYIIVHELCHTIEKNHGKKFWNKVKSVLPNYKIDEKWLKDNRGIINVI